MTPTETLQVLEAIHDRCDLSGNAEYVSAVTTVPFVIPTATMFEDQSGYWNFVTAYDTQYQIETTQIVAIWINDLKKDLEEEDRVLDSPVKHKRYELTLFTQSNFERLDENASLNSFEKKCSKAHLDHDFTREALDTQFMGTNSLGLDEEVFATAETISLIEIEETEREVSCPFFTKDNTCLGSVTKFDCTANIQTVAC